MKEFSKDAYSFMGSPVREIFKKVDLFAIYSFAGGYPDASTFPMEEIPGILSTVIEKYGSKVLQYGSTLGVPILISAVSSRYGVDKRNILISTSSQQGIDVCTRVLADPGDVILTTDPTYLGALQSFKAYRTEIVSVPCEILSEGVRIEALEQKLRAAKFFYVIPDFRNPSGETLTLEERKNLVRLAEEYDFLIVEDSPYRELRYDGSDLPTIYSLAPSRTIHLGSFSKIFAPGLRLGWIFAPEEILNKIYLCKQSLDLCAPVLDQYIAAEYITSGILEARLPKTIDLYRSKRDLMLSLLEKYMPEGVSWTRPEGGLFLFVTLPDGVDTEEMHIDALASGVAYVPGKFMFVDGSHCNTMRLNYSFLSSERMEAGVKILSEVIGRHCPVFHKYSGAGNDFIVLREDESHPLEKYRSAEVISRLCDRKTGFVASDGRIGADGLMILSEDASEGVDFKMEYFNSDGSGGMMCGNGGRCITAFACDCGIRPASGREYRFSAPDGIHTGEILSCEGEHRKIVRIRMIDAFGLRRVLGGYFLNTGTRHFVKFTDDVEAVDLGREGRELRWNEEFAPEGANVNFVQVQGDGSLKIRTFEKGVEAETLACGTGVTAAAVAAWYEGIRPVNTDQVHYDVRTRIETLSVDFVPVGDSGKAGCAESVFLTGPAEKII